MASLFGFTIRHYCFYCLYSIIIKRTFVSTREALITVLPQASKEDIENYDEQLSKVDLFDPVLIISANQNWINQNTYAAYQQVMNAFVTVNLPQNTGEMRIRAVYSIFRI
ncbi:hypothetical protein RclHR1_00200001 [Rhizophagus clarus]|uniref:Uncharacterized protein n=1 Tax=Rhizophagus clarus TaxID=94130 RepID=A0A2Z6RIQ6_9GLOM|nr:hypothetical protein RclHR1_00200001 [Rhizophagus clarus]